MLPPTPKELARQLLEQARQDLEHLTAQGGQASQRDQDIGRAHAWYAYCRARDAGLTHAEIARILHADPQELWQRWGEDYRHLRGQGHSE
jgi:hypothetical protein